MVPLKKQSKKMQKAFHNSRRGSWNGVCPVTRVAQGRKAYDRSREKAAARRGEDE